MWAAALVILLTAAIARPAPAGSFPPPAGITVKADAINGLALPGLKIRPLPVLALEGYWVGPAAEYDGFGVRAMLILPDIIDSRPGVCVRPYIGMGYLRIEQEKSFSGGTETFVFGDRSLRIEATGEGKASGSGIQLFAGVETRPFRSYPNIALEFELGHAFFEVDGRGRATVTADGTLPELASVSRVDFSSDYRATSLMVGISIYFN